MTKQKNNWQRIHKCERSSNVQFHIHTSSLNVLNNDFTMGNVYPYLRLWHKKYYVE